MIALEDLRGILVGFVTAAYRRVVNLVSADRADKVLQDGYGVALRGLGEPILADIAEGIDHVAPIRTLVRAGRYGNALDCPIDVRLNAATIMLAPSSAGAER